MFCFRRVIMYMFLILIFEHSILVDSKFSSSKQGVERMWTGSYFKWWVCFAFFFFFKYFFSHTVHHPYQTFTSAAFGIQISNFFPGRECSASEKFLLAKSMTTFLFKLVKSFDFFTLWLFIGFTIQVACSSLTLSFKGKTAPKLKLSLFH